MIRYKVFINSIRDNEINNIINYSYDTIKKYCKLNKNILLNDNFRIIFDNITISYEFNNNDEKRNKSLFYIIDYNAIKYNFFIYLPYFPHDESKLFSAIYKIKENFNFDYASFVKLENYGYDRFYFKKYINNLNEFINQLYDFINNNLFKDKLFEIVIHINKQDITCSIYILQDLLHQFFKSKITFNYNKILREYGITINENYSEITFNKFYSKINKIEIKFNTFIKFFENIFTQLINYLLDIDNQYTININTNNLKSLKKINDNNNLIFKKIYEDYDELYEKEKIFINDFIEIYNFFDENTMKIINILI